MTHDETQIRALLDALTRAIHDRDAQAAIAPLHDDAITFDLAPPLRQDAEATHDPALLEEWFATWTGPIHSVPHDLEVAVGGDVAYAFGLQHMTGTKTDGSEVDLWFRVTACFRREGNRWRIAHLHHSVPFAMDARSAAVALRRGRRRAASREDSPTLSRIGCVLGRMGLLRYRSCRELHLLAPASSHPARSCLADRWPARLGRRRGRQG